MGQASTPARVLQNPLFGERISPLVKPESRPMQSHEHGRPDLVLPRYHAVIFVHGCFWHGHTCHLVKKPATRETFWQEKLGNNAARDKGVLASLQAAGWKAAVVWECALRGTSKLPLDVVMRRIVRYITGRTATVLEIAGSQERLSRRRDRH